MSATLEYISFEPSSFSKLTTPVRYQISPFVVDNDKRYNVIIFFFKAQTGIQSNICETKLSLFQNLF